MGYFGRRSHALNTIISHLLSFLKSNFVSPLRSHTTFSPCSFLFSLLPRKLRELCFTFSHLLSHSHSLAFPPFIASSPKCGRIDRFLRNPLSRFFLSSRSYARTRFSRPNTFCHQRRNTWNCNSQTTPVEVKTRWIRRTIVIHLEITELYVHGKFYLFYDA